MLIPLFFDFSSDGPGGFISIAFLDFNRETDGLPFAVTNLIDAADLLNVALSGDSGT